MPRYEQEVFRGSLPSGAKSGVSTPSRDALERTANAEQHASLVAGDEKGRGSRGGWRRGSAGRARITDFRLGIIGIATGIRAAAPCGSSSLPRGYKATAVVLSHTPTVASCNPSPSPFSPRKLRVPCTYPFFFSPIVFPASPHPFLYIHVRAQPTASAVHSVPDATLSSHGYVDNRVVTTELDCAAAREGSNLDRLST